MRSSNISHFRAVGPRMRLFLAFTTNPCERTSRPCSTNLCPGSLWIPLYIWSWSISSIPHQVFVSVDTHAACCCCFLQCLNYTSRSIPWMQYHDSQPQYDSVRHPRHPSPLRRPRDASRPYHVGMQTGFSIIPNQRGTLSVLLNGLVSRGTLPHCFPPLWSDFKSSSPNYLVSVHKKHDYELIVGTASAVLMCLC